MDLQAIKNQKQACTQIHNPLPQRKKKRQAFVNIKAASWKSNQGGLFDYKAKKNDLFLQNFNPTKNSVIFRNHSNNITTLHNQQDYGQVNLGLKNPLWKIKFLENERAIGILPVGKIQQKAIENRQNLQSNDVFIVIDSNEKNNTPQSLGYNLQVGDIIKFGHAIYLVHEINDQKNSKSFVQSGSSQQNGQIYRVQQKIDQQKLCRICYLSSHTETNPLINPCQCKGDVKYTHLQCFKTWINSKVKTTVQIHGIVSSYNFDKFYCEVCKQKLPQIIKLENEQEVFLLDFKKPDRPYILLKSMTTKQNQANKMHFICPQNGIIKVGRSQKSDLVESKQMTTVSRDHAQIQFKKGQFYIRDLSSKFGTLIKFRKGITLQNKQQVRFQYKNTLYTISNNKTIQQ